MALLFLRHLFLPDVLDPVFFPLGKCLPLLPDDPMPFFCFWCWHFFFPLFYGEVDPSTFSFCRTFARHSCIPILAFGDPLGEFFYADPVKMFR